MGQIYRCGKNSNKVIDILSLIYSQECFTYETSNMYPYKTETLFISLRSYGKLYPFWTQYLKTFLLDLITMWDFNRMIAAWTLYYIKCSSGLLLFCQNLQNCIWQTCMHQTDIQSAGLHSFLRWQFGYSLWQSDWDGRKMDLSTIFMNTWEPSNIILKMNHTNNKLLLFLVWRL